MKLGLMLMPWSHSGGGAHLGKYRRIQETSNLREFTKKAGKCGHVINGLHTATSLLRCSSTVLRLNLNKKYTENTLPTGEDI